jgi:hypothetical protein
MSHRLLSELGPLRDDRTGTCPSGSTGRLRRYGRGRQDSGSQEAAAGLHGRRLQ